MTDSDSPPPITFGQALWNIVLSSKYSSFDPKNRLRNFEGDGEGKQKGDREWWDLIGWILSVFKSDWLVFSTNGRAHKQTSNFCFLYSSFQDWEQNGYNRWYRIILDYNVVDNLVFGRQSFTKDQQIIPYCIRPLQN
jgi:hypothetical protein